MTKSRTTSKPRTAADGLKPQLPPQADMLGGAHPRSYTPLNASDEAALAPALLAWYDIHRRNLPWRAAKGVKAPAYHVWLSEIMLQQTTVKAVIPYFERFVKHWPTVEHMARAPQADILDAWAGLGYYARARNMHACAQAVAGEYGGHFPESEAELKRLPGIGDYTAAAISSIAFAHPATVVDGNVERVTSRLYSLSEPLPAAKKAIKTLTARISPTNTQARPGDFAQAMMDLGAGICTPKNPTCGLCPLSDICTAFKHSTPETYPVKAPKKTKPVRHTTALLLMCDGKILLERRPEKGLLGGTLGLPSTHWQEAAAPLPQNVGQGQVKPQAQSWSQQVAAALPDTLDQSALNWGIASGAARHTFTHFHLDIQLAYCEIATLTNLPEGFVWATQATAAKLPTVFKKMLSLASFIAVP